MAYGRGLCLRCIVCASLAVESSWWPGFTGTCKMVNLYDLRRPETNLIRVWFRSTVAKYIGLVINTHHRQRKVDCRCSQWFRHVLWLCSLDTLATCRNRHKQRITDACVFVLVRSESTGEMFGNLEEQRLLDRISKAYHLPDWCSVSAGNINIFTVHLFVYHVYIPQIWISMKNSND